MKPRVDLSGKRFGKLTVMGLDTRAGFEGFWICRCECSRATTVRAGNLTSGNTKSCGCIKRTSARSTNYEKTRSRAGDTKLSWESMITRCYNPKAHNYASYGGQGGTVDPRWRESYDNFLADLGERPPGTTIDRHPNPYGNYEPGNCRWGTPKEQANNRRDNVIIEAFGKKQTFRQWADEYNVPPGTLYDRFYKRKMPFEKALTNEKYSSLKTQEMKDKFYRNRRSNFFIEAFGQRKTLVEWAEEYGIRPAVLSARIRRRGMAPEEAMTTPLMPRGQRHNGMKRKE